MNTDIPKRNQCRFADQLRDWAGSAFFLLVTLIAVQSAWQQRSILFWMYAVHNGLLAFFYLQRAPVKSYDRTGLWLGLIAAFLPTWSLTGSVSWFILLPALASYALILWSLVTLGPRFGIAPADRGLTCRGPYRYLRHPMYLGELLFRLILIIPSPQIMLSLVLSLLLMGIQCWRILREEKMIEGYTCYQHLVPWRLIPGIW